LTELLLTIDVEMMVISAESEMDAKLIWLDTLETHGKGPDYLYRSKSVPPLEKLQINNSKVQLFHMDYALDLSYESTKLLIVEQSCSDLSRRR
jgi:hypothetical protein